MKTPSDLDSKIQSVFKEVFEHTSDFQHMRRGVDKWDSLKHMDLVVGLEQKFQIRLSMDEIMELETISACVTVIDDHLNNS